VIKFVAATIPHAHRLAFAIGLARPRLSFNVACTHVHARIHVYAVSRRLPLCESWLGKTGLQLIPRQKRSFVSAQISRTFARTMTGGEGRELGGKDEGKGGRRKWKEPALAMIHCRLPGMRRIAERASRTTTNASPRNKRRFPPAPKEGRAS